MSSRIQSSVQMKFYLSLLFTLVFCGFMFAAMLECTVWWLQAIFGILTTFSLIFFFLIFVQELNKSSKQ